MPAHRPTPPEGAVAFPLAARGVYVSQHLVKGHREVFAVDSHGEQVAVRYVPKSADTSDVEVRLWEALDELDPIMPHERGPSLRLVRGD